jgi:hypothetical protein
MTSCAILIPVEVIHAFFIYLFDACWIDPGRKRFAEEFDNTREGGLLSME